MVNNGGDIGKTLEQLGSEQSIKGLLTTMVTAGALDTLNSSMSIDGVKLSNINAQNAGLGANLEESLNIALAGALVSAAAGQTAFKIGDVTVNDQLTKALAHALAGCVAGSAGAGSPGCSSGAIGAVVGELSAQWYDNPPGSRSPADVLNFAKVISAAAGALTGDGSAQSVNTAVMTGGNAVENNYLYH